MGGGGLTLGSTNSVLTDRAASFLAGPLQGNDLGVLDPLKSVGAFTDYPAFAIHNDGAHAGIRRS